MSHKSRSLVYKRGDSGNWYVTKTRKSTGTTDKRRAEALAAQQITAQWDRKNLGIAPVKTWDKACLSWIDEIGKGIKSGKNQGYICQALTPHFTGLYLTEITKERVAKVMQDRITREPSAKNNTANQYVAFVAKIVRHGGIVPPKFVKYPTKGSRDRYLTVDEWRTLSQAMPDDFRQICTFAVATGLREANVMLLEWEWVNGDMLIIPKEFTKTAKPYGIPLNKTAMGILGERREAPVKSLKYAFLRDGKPWHKVAVSRAMKGAIDASGVAPITFHGLRHTFASWLTQRGVEWPTVARLGCWKVKGMGGIYAHMNVEHLRPYSELIDEILVKNPHSDLQNLVKSAS